MRNVKAGSLLPIQPNIHLHRRVFATNHDMVIYSADFFHVNFVTICGQTCSHLRRSVMVCTPLNTHIEKVNLCSKMLFCDRPPFLDKARGHNLHLLQGAELKVSNAAAGAHGRSQTWHYLHARIEKLLHPDIATWNILMRTRVAYFSSYSSEAHEYYICLLEMVKTSKRDSLTPCLLKSPAWKGKCASQVVNRLHSRTRHRQP